MTDHYTSHLVPLHLDTSVAGNRLDIPSGIIGLRLESMPPGVVLGLFEKGAQEPARIILPGSSYHFESEDCQPDHLEVMTAVLGTAFLTAWRRGVVLLGGAPSPRRPGTATLIYPDDPAPYGANPDTGGDIIVACPSDRVWEAIQIAAHLQTSATLPASNRNPVLAIRDAKGHLLQKQGQTSIPGNTKADPVWLNTMLSAGFVPPGGTIRFQLSDPTTGVVTAQAGDQWSGAVVFVYEHLVP